MYIKLDKNIVSSVIFLFAENSKHYFFNFPLYLKRKTRQRVFPLLIFILSISDIAR